MTETYCNPIDNRLNIALKIAKNARGISLPAFRTNQEISNKTAETNTFDPVTKTDLAVEASFRPIINEAFPNDSIVGEEFPDETGNSGWTWFLDPIDGTRSFVSGLPTWSTLIGVQNDEKGLSLGVIDLPALNECYYGKLSSANFESSGLNKEIRVSDCRSLDEATISTTDPFILNRLEQEGWKSLRQSARIIRYGLDAYAYARLAAGSIDLVAESGLQPWDMCALVPLVRGAGGIVCDWDGSSPKLGGRIVCAATQSLMDEALNFLSSC